MLKAKRLIFISIPALLFVNLASAQVKDTVLKPLDTTRAVIQRPVRIDSSSKKTRHGKS